MTRNIQHEAARCKIRHPETLIWRRGKVTTQIRPKIRLGLNCLGTYPSTHSAGNFCHVFGTNDEQALPQA